MEAEVRTRALQQGGFFLVDALELAEVPLRCQLSDQGPQQDVAGGEGVVERVRWRFETAEVAQDDDGWFHGFEALD